jgi:hypothetical protein
MTATNALGFPLDVRVLKRSPDRAIPRTFVETSDIIVRAGAMPLRTVDECFWGSFLRQRGYTTTESGKAGNS